MNPFNYDLGDLTQSRILNTFSRFPGDMYTDKHIVYRKSPELEKFRDSSILLVGGGPSTVDFFEEWEGLDVDYRWTVNHFYQNLSVRQVHFDLLSLSTDIDFHNKTLLDYLDIEQSLVAVEPRVEWDRKKRFINEEFYETNKLICFSTHFAGKIGCCARVMILAAQIGVKEIYMIGMDGPKPMFENKHAFKRVSVKIPSGITPENAHAIYLDQYNVFWDYMRKNWPNTKCISLDNNIYHETI